MVLASIEGAIIAAILIPCGALGVTLLVLRVVDHRETMSRDAFSAEVIFIPAAQAATDLIPLINQLPLQNSDLWIFGEDGRNFTKDNGGKFAKAILTWVKKGLRVKYILLCPGEGVKDVMGQLVAESLASKGALDLWTLKGDGDNVSAAEFLRSIDLPEMRTRHPTLFFGPDDCNAMWLEGEHRQDSKFAYNVRYVSPTAMTPDYKGEFEKQRKNITTILDHCEPWSSYAEAA